MTTATMQKIEDLFRQKRWDEALPLIREYLSTADVSDAASQGATYMAVASAYLQAMNEVQQEYNQVLEGTLSLLRDLKPIQSQMADDVDLTRVNKDIDSLN